MTAGVAGGRMLARNTTLNLLGLGLPLLIGVFTMPAVIRGLGADRFGILALVWVALGYLNLLDMGLGRAVTRFAAEAIARRDDRRLVLSAWTAAALQTALGIAGALLVAAAAPVLVQRFLSVPDELVGQATRSFQLLALAAPVLALTNTFRGLLEAAQRFDLVNAVRAPVSATNFLLPLIGVWLAWTLPGIVIAMVAMRFVTLAAFAAMALRVHPALARRPAADRALSRELISFGGWITVASLVTPILIYADRFAIGGMLTVAAVTFYAAPHEVMTRLTLLPSSLVATLFPAFSAVSAGGRAELERLLGLAVKALLLAVGPLLVVLAILAPELLHLWLGEEFARASTPVLRLLALGLLANALAYVPSALIQARGRPDVTALLQLAELPAHLVLLWLFVGWWGITGAAAAWSLRMVLDAALLFGAAHRLRIVSVPAALGRRVPEALLAVLGLAVAGMAAAAAAPGVLPTLGIAALALAAAATWVGGRLFTAAERTRAWGTLRGAR